MAWTNWGFDGTINEAQWAQMAGLLGNGYVAAGNGDCVVTAVSGARSVSVAAGTLYGDGVVSVNSGAETVAMTTPVNGQWYVIALRRTWATNTAALVAIAGATTTTTTPTAPPTSFPTLNTNVGVLTDQPIAWAWCNSANTTVVVYDIRLKAVKSLPPVVANGTERDAKFMAPTQGLQVWRDDLGAVETYYGLYNASTNPGGRDSAGWYVNDRQTGLIPLKASSILISGGSATQNSMGTITFSGTSYVIPIGVFTNKYKSYRIVIHEVGSAAETDLGFRMTTAGSYHSSLYYWGGARSASATNQLVSLNGANVSYYLVNQMSTTASFSGGFIDLHNPANATTTSINSKMSGYVSGLSISSYSTDGAHANSASYDGFGLLPIGATTISGSMTIYGIND